MSPLTRVRGLLTALLLALFMLVGAFTTSAQAALTSSLTTASPADTSAMAYSNYTIDASFGADNDGVSPRSLQFDLPKGQLGAVMNATTCTDANFNADNCAASSQIGDVLVNGNAVAIGFINIDVAAVGGIYRLNTVGTEAARIGIVADDPNAKPLFITGVMRLRPDYGITAYVDNVPNTATADLFSMGVDVDVSRMKMVLYGRVGGGTSGNGFMFNPGECTTATTVARAYSATSYGGSVFTSSKSYTPTGCASAPFNPSVSFNPAGSPASSPTAFSVVAANPYNATDAKVGSPFKTAAITLPDGVQLSGAANSDGSLVACTDAQFAYTSLAPSTCPAGSKVGTVAMDSPLVGVVPGDVYLAQPSTGANNLVRLFMTAQLGTASDAVRVKLLADVSIDPSTGKLITTLTNLPAQPVKSFTFTFRAGTNPGTRQPRMCGTYAGTGDLTSYSSSTPASRSANYTVTTNCPTAGTFRPTIGMTTSPTKAGAFTTGTTTIDLPVGDEPMSKLTASLPQGMIANISGVTRCTQAQVTADSCPAGTAIGTVTALSGQSTVPGTFTGTVYLTDTPDSQGIAGLYIRVPVQVGPIAIDTLKISSSLRLRTDFGIDVVSDIPTDVRKLQLDMQRLQLVFNKANFLVNPPVCSGNTVGGSFQSSLGTTKSASSAMTITGCSSLLFAPTLAFTAAPASAGGASSFTASVSIPASTSGSEQSAPKKISITLPDGVSLSPSASSDGSLVGCSDAQFTINDFADPTCPTGSNVGTVSIQTPSVGHLTGTAYLGTAPTGHTARLLVDATSDDFGTKARVKLEGLLDVNATTGNVTAVFDNIPKVQFTNFAITLRGGTKPVVSMPRTCGTYSGSSAMTPWSGNADATPSASITLNTNCTDSTSFAPTLGVSFSPTTAGVSTTMTAQVDVPERHRQLDNIALSLPAGLLANIDGLTRCSIANANAGTCPAATKIGTVDALAGQGTTPGTFTGSLYLTDAPNSADIVGIAVALPAVVGPVDLGTVTTIADVKLRPSDYGIDITAAVPTSQKGVPLYLRRLKLTVNKSGFMTNPVTCGATTITSTLHGAGGSTVTPSVAYQATGCASLGFNPTVAFSATPAQAAGASAFTATITAPAGTDAAPQAALKKAVVDLPTGVSLSPSINSDSALVGCTAAQFSLSDFSDPTCAAGSAIGTATIVTPQVGTLTGSVYLANTAPGSSIAGLYLDAKSTQFGSAARVKLSGQIDVDASTGKTTATFDNAPAVAFTSFALAMRGGTKPALSMPRACGTPSGTATLSPQSGSSVSRSGTLTINANCGNDTTFAPTGSVTLGTLAAGSDTSLTTVVNVPSGNRELAHVDVSLPTGLLANIQGKTRCTVANAQAGTCTAASEIGTVSADAGQGTNPGTFSGGKVYLVDAPTSSDVVGLGISIPVAVGPVDLGKVNVVGSVKLRSDYGIDISADVPTSIKGIPMYLRKLTIAITKSGLLFNPSTCGSKTASLKMTSASYSGATSTANDSSSFTIGSCAALPLDPTIGYSGSPSQAGGASAFTTTISLPSSPAQSAIKQVDMTLPTGVSLSPSINSDGALVGCTDAQFDATNTFSTPTCPTGSKVGSVSIMTSSVGQLTGDVFLASTAPGHIARVMVHAVSVDYPSVHVKMSGTVDSDSSTGVASASFTGLPEVPFTAFAITFRGGTNPVISMPRTCGTPSGSAAITGHAGNAVVNRSATLTVDQQCADTNSFAPTFSNAISPTTAGVSSTLTSTVNIPVRHRALDQLTLSLPAGLLANVDGLTRCSIAAANAGTCAAATKIGSVTAKAGQGTTPGTFNGSLYLTDAPAAGDVVGIAVALPAVVGPVDLGTITTIADVKLRPSDYGIDVVATIPTSVKGIPLHMQQLKLTVDKANFLTNPTTCAATNTVATMHGAGGSNVSSNAAFQATGCASLGFNPTVAFSASPAQAAGASAFTTTITAPAGTDASPQGALKKAVVDLPTGTSLSASINSDGNLAGCTSAQFSASDFSDPTCPSGSVVGTATIAVPQVGSLTGNVYLAQTAPGSSIAGLYLDAKSTQFGSAVRVKLTGQVDVDASTGKTTATFDNAPAIAFTSFQLALRGGSSPVISVPRSCGTPSGTASLTSQAGTTVSRSGTLTINTGCGNDTNFAATGSVALSDLRAGQDTNLTTTVNVPSGNRELAKVAISLPAGLLAKIDGLTRCSVANAQAGTCAAATEIGTISADAGQGSAPATFAGKAYLVDAPTSSDMVAIGLSIPVKVGPVDLGTVNVVAPVKLRSDYGIDITADVPTQIKGIPMYLRKLTINVNKAGFLFNPSTCATRNATMQLTSASYSGASSTANTSDALTFTQCANLGFTPSVAFTATPASAGGAGAFSTKITLPSSPAQSALKRAVVALPAGVSLSPSIDSAGNLTGCTDAQFDANTPFADPTCPTLSKIGDATIVSPTVGSLTGGVYLAATGSGHLARVFAFARSTNFPGAGVKLTGTVDVDASTGIATADFSGAPEVPFTSFEIAFRGGTNPALSLPRTCGTPTGTASLTSHADATAITRTGTLTINANCTSSFAPTATVTTSPTTAAAATALTTTISVPAASQELSRVRLSLPSGLVAKIDGHAKCTLANANAGTCQAAAKIGTLSAKAGQGTAPASFGSGSVYLTDAPTSGDLVGLAVELPVKVGSVGGTAIVDLGKVTAVGSIDLRQDYGIDIDMAVPTSLKGIPIYTRELTLAINESGFMVNPASCTGNAITGTLNSAQGGSTPISTSLTVSNCAGATFNPSVAFSAAPSQPAAAAAFTTTLTLPTGDQSPVKKAVVTLPTGVSLTASANANGDLTGCTDAQFAASTWADPTCPAGSKVGSVAIATPSVGAINGDVYLASTAPNGSIARVFLDAKSTTYGSQARIKVEGTIAVDPDSGATTATFDNLPPVAFTSFAMTLRGGTAPVVSLPRTCGAFAGQGVLTPAAGSVATKSGSLTLSNNCPAASQFGPKMALDLTPNSAGGSGVLTTSIRVPAGDQELSKVKINMPEGLTAKLKGATRCSIADAQNDACAAATQIGTVSADVGVAGAAYTQTGKVYLTDGRSGNVAGMAIVLPAVVGPIDLGKVITIADVQLHSPDLALQITADVPTSVKGVRLDVRKLDITVNKPGFIVNPSACTTLPGSAAFNGKQGATATDSASITIDASSCGSQTFSPQIAFSAGNPVPGEASDFTTDITLDAGSGSPSPFKSATVRLPAGMSLSASANHNGDLAGCTDGQFHQDDLSVTNSCPAGAEIGNVRISTDLVGDLVGKAYLASGTTTGTTLARVFMEGVASDVPNLTVRLVGEIKVDPTTGATDAVFDDVPAIPVTEFKVTFRGGTSPVLAMPRLCATAAGTGTFVPVNGSTVTRNASLAVTSSCPDPNAFSPTIQLDRSNTNAGQSMNFTTTVNVPAKQQELSKLSMNLPAGLLGKISSIPACKLADAKAGNCAASSKVGDVSAQVGVASAPFTVSGGAYLVEGDSTHIARLAMVLPAKVGPVDLGNIITMADLTLRGDYGLNISADDIPTTVKGVRIDLHQFVLSINKSDFMVNPVSCDAATAASNLRAAQGGSQDRSQALTTTACDQLSLNASLGFNAAPASPAVSSKVTTQIRANADAGKALDALKNVHVTLPEGVSLSPSAGARGDLAECHTADFNAADITVDANCPAGSKVGTVTLSSPMVGGLSGDVFLGPKTDGHFASIFFQAKAADYPSLRVKIAGSLDVDSTTGRLAATFTGLPQVQVSAIDLALRGDDAPVLSLPRTCGQFGGDLNVVRYGGSTSDATGSLTLDQDCPDANAFSPSLTLSNSTDQAGSNAQLTTTIKVPARQQELSSMDVKLPAGLLGRLTVAPQCSVDNAKSNNCGAESQIGTASAKVGVATAPYGVDGKVYLTDGFDGSIAGLMFALPAKVGPIDLGTVITLAQIKIEGNDLRMRIVASSIPTRVQGIPLNLSQLQIKLDRDGLVVNPSTCGTANADASYGSAQGGSASDSTGYTTGGCGNLNWQPNMQMSFSGPATEMAVKGHPTISSVISQTEGQGNLRSAKVTLPDGLAADLTNVNKRICASADAAASGACADTAKVGTAEIVTSALREPVNGDIIMVKVPGAALPGLVVHVRDQISMDLVGTSRVDGSSGRLQVNFDGVPDTPMSKMTLVFSGGSTGIVQVGKAFCGISGLKTDATLAAQHGATKTFALPVDCNGAKSTTGAETGNAGVALATATFRPSGTSSALTFALSNPNGIKKIVIKMPKGAIFTKKASKLVKLSLTGGKAKVRIVNGDRRIAISIIPTDDSAQVTKVKFKLPKKAIKINIKVRKVLENKKISKKKRAKTLAKLLSPDVTTVDGKGTTATVKLKTAFK